MLDSFIRANKKFHPRTFLEECKYKIKNNEMENLDSSLSDEFDSDPDSESDSGPDNEYDNDESNEFKH